MEKDFDELSTMEMATLNDDELKWYVDLECAKKGVLLPPPQPEKPILLPVPPPDVTVYCVGDYCFTSADAALELQQCLDLAGARTCRYVPGQSYDKVLSAGYTETAIKQERMYTHDFWENTVKDTRKNNDTAKANHNAALAEWTPFYDAYMAIYDVFHDRVVKAQVALKRMYELSLKFERYHQLARGNMATAWTFFTEAYGECNQETKDYIEDRISKASTDTGT